MTKNLPELKYYPDWILYLYVGNKLYYLIPWEITNEGWEDQIYGYKVIESEFGIYVYNVRISKWLGYLTNISSEDYYRRYIIRIQGTAIPRCPICGKFKRYVSPTKGYRLTCSNPYECTALLGHQLNYYPIFNIVSNINSCYSRFIHRGNINDPCCYYIAWYRDYNWYKIGITCDYIESRTRWDKGSILHRHILITGTRLEIATLERDIKLYFHISREFINADLFREFKVIFRKEVKRLKISNKFEKLKFYY